MVIEDSMIGPIRYDYHLTTGLLCLHTIRLVLASPLVPSPTSAADYTSGCELVHLAGSLQECRSGV